MRKEMYIYPAIFHYADDGISIEFPDLPGCLSSADTDEEAAYNAKEVLALYLHVLEEDNEEIPTPTEFSKLKLEANEIPVLIEVWMPYHRARVKTVYIKKTLTIPNWLNSLAEHHHVNFSQILQSALKEYLGIQNKSK
jgi:predicted RNase H-like HicB family nuclease